MTTLVTVLTKLFSTEVEAKVLLLRVSFPKLQLDPFVNVELFWQQTLDKARLGALADADRTIVRAALGFYPFNQDLLDIATELHLERPDQTPDPSLLSKGELPRYRAKAHALHHTIELADFDTTTRIGLELVDLHVPLDVWIDPQARYRPQVGGKRKGADPGRERAPLTEALREAWSRDVRGVVLLGGPGSGKTTELEHVLLELLQLRGPESLGLPPDTIPVFLSLRSLRDRAAGLPGLIQQELHSPLRDMKEDFGERLCRRGRVLYLLDGLDEVPEQERVEVARWIEQAHRHTIDSFFLVGSRHASYTRDVWLATFLELHLQPLDNEQVAQFIGRWYSTHQRATTVDSSRAEREATRKTAALAQIISQAERSPHARLAEMKRNPLLLTAICLVHGDGERLPPARVRLYEQIVTVLSKRWQARCHGLSLSDALEILRSLAAWIHEQAGRTRFSPEALRAQLEQYSSQQPELTMAADALLRTLLGDSGLFVTLGPDEHGFAYLGLQEYLAAQSLHAQGLAQPEALRTLAARFGDAWWHEVTLMMLSLDPSVFDEFMRAVVQRPELARWIDSELMQQCLQRPVKWSISPFVDMLKIPHGSTRAADLEARQLAVLTLIQREWPRELARLHEELLHHPTEAVRAWWRELAGEGHETVVSPSGGVELVLVRGGRFVMGSAWDTGDRDEQPPHEVELHSFYMARAPVTNAQYAEYSRANPSATPPKFWGNDLFNRPDQPVVGISWHDARAFCEWAGLQLPTETQWEYACRAGTRSRFWSGDADDDLERVGWCFSNSKGRLQPVGLKAPNDFGLHDMHGNIWEWCQDAYGGYEAAPHAADGLRHVPDGATKHVRRGGGFRALADFARSALRGHDYPDQRHDDLGLRPILLIRRSSWSGSNP